MSSSSTAAARPLRLSALRNLLPYPGEQPVTQIKPTLRELGEAVVGVPRLPN